MGYFFGLGSWVIGFPCLETAGNGRWRVSLPKLGKHALKLFLWAVAIETFARLGGVYRYWLRQGSSVPTALAFLIPAMIFIYIKVFWPRRLIEFLPGFRRFLCPQCFQYQTFRFTPFSFQYGFLVTYLCRYCFCLVDNWGEQVYYPLKMTWEKTAPLLLCLIPVSAGVILGALIVSKILWGFF